MGKWRIFKLLEQVLWYLRHVECLVVSSPPKVNLLMTYL